MRSGPLRRFLADESGVTVIDYAMLICCIALVVVTLAGSGVSPTNTLARIGFLGASLADEEGGKVAIPTLTHR